MIQTVMERRDKEVNILVIDEQLADLGIICHELGEVGFSFKVASVAATDHALQDLLGSGFRADVVLCPFSLPNTNVLHMLKSARAAGCEAPFILLAFDLAEEIAIELLSSGIEDYITRNTLKRLPVVIRKAIQRHETLTELKESHAQLKASDRAIRSMVRNTPLAVAMFDTNMQYLVASEKWLQGAGAEENDLLGKSLYDHSPPQSDTERQLHLYCLEGNTYSSDEEAVIYNGRNFWIRIKIAPWYAVENRVGGLVMFVEDITESILRSRQLDEERSRLSMAIESADLGLWSWQFGSHTIEFNEIGARIYGFNELSVAVQDLAMGVHTEDRARIADSINSTFYNKTPYDEEYRYVRSDGTEITVHSMGRASHDRNGVPVHLYGVMIDRTVRSRLEREIRDREQLFRDMAENITEVFWLTDYQANQILYMSPQYERLFGKTVQSIYDVSASWADNIHPEDRPGILEAFKKNAPLGTFNVEYRIVHPDGNIYWVHDRAFPIKDEQGNVLRIAGLSRDITRMKLLQSDAQRC